MTDKKKPAKKRDPNRITVIGKPNEDGDLTLARHALRPTVQAALTINSYNKAFGPQDLTSLIEALVEQTDASNEGDLSRAEAMLTMQAHTLDAIFNNLAKRAITTEYMNNLDTYLKLALRAQSQCRATWEALAAIKYPPMMGYVKQANIAHGPQQVNNAIPDTRAREYQNPQNKQLEQKDGERLDTGTTGTTGKANPAMETVGEIDRAEDQVRKG